MHTQKQSKVVCKDTFWEAGLRELEIVRLTSVTWLPSTAASTGRISAAPCYAHMQPGNDDHL